VGVALGVAALLLLWTVTTLSDRGDLLWRGAFVVAVASLLLGRGFAGMGPPGHVLRW
jgi:hypothetical protein